MENFDNWEMLKTAVAAEETEEILTNAIITDFENITKHQNDAVKIKQEKYCDYDFNVDILSTNNNNKKNNNDDDDGNSNNSYVSIKKESIEISVDETDCDDGGNSIDDDAIFNFTNDTLNVQENNNKKLNTEKVVEDKIKVKRPVRAAAIAKFGLTQKQALDEPPLDYESAIIYICPACGCEYFSHEAWKRHMHVQHKFNSPEGLNFKKIDKLYNECQQCLKPIAMHSIENLLKHKFTHLPFRCTKCRICMRQYKYRQDLMVHLRMTHLLDLAQIKKTGEWTKENIDVFEREQREHIESTNNSNIFAIKDVQANAIDIHGNADNNNENKDDEDDDAVYVQNERLELDDDEDLIEYDINESKDHKKIGGIHRKSLLERALCGKEHNESNNVEEGFSEPDIKLCEPFIMHICPQCGDTYEKQNEWEDHIEVKHNFGTATGLGFELQDNGNIAMCTECSKLLPNELCQLQLHRFSHTRHRQWMRCSLCYRAFTSLKDLIRHLLVQHNLANSPADDYEDMENYQLETCNRDHFEQHIEYLCPQCGKNYKDRKLWRRHLIYAHRLADLKVLHFRVINETQVICLDCKKVITNAYGIQNAQQHRFTHMPFKAYIRCRICNKSYTERKGTVKHLRKTHHISISNMNPIATTTTESIKVRFEDNHTYYSKRSTTEPNISNKPKREIVRKNNYLYEIKFLDDVNAQKLNYCASPNNNNHNDDKNHKISSNDNDYDDDDDNDNNNDNDNDYIDDNAAVPELIFNNIKKYHNETQYKCNYCAARFNHHRSLMLHINESHEKQGEQKRKKFNYEEQPSKKIRTHDELKKTFEVNLENYYYFLCPACGEEFAEQRIWREHINEVHHFNKRHGLNFKPISPYSYKCLQCDVIVDSKLQAMQEHKFCHLPYVRCVKCRLCKAAFSKKSNILDHLCITHNISETESMINMPKENHFQQENENNNMIKMSKITKATSATTTKKSLLPAVAAAITNSIGTEYGHNAVDHANITYFCPLCNENFLTHYMWRRHIVDEHNFNNCEGLNFRKINEHHFLCLQCYKRVTVTHSKGAICQLQSHKFRHLPHRSFKCTACNEMFVRKQMFFKHLDKFTNHCALMRHNKQLQDKPSNNKKKTTKLNDDSRISENNNVLVNDYEESEMENANENEENHLQYKQKLQEEEKKEGCDIDRIGENQEPFMFVCPSCGQEFYKLYLWREHINNEHHLNIREVLNFKRISATQHQCLQCFECVNGKKLRDLQAHKFKHLTHTHYLRCLLCKASYTHLRNMQDHIRNRHPEVYIDKLNSTEGNRSFRSNDDTEESCLPNNCDTDASTNELLGGLSFHNDI